MGRWSKNHCPGSVAAAVHYVNLTSYEAEEGTAAHELAETCLKLCLNADAYLGHEFNGISVNDEMVEGVQSYLDFIRAILKAFPGTEMYVEHKFHLPQIHQFFYGTIDTLLINRELRWAHNIDFKYGRVPVPATTPQLDYYSVPLIVDNAAIFEPYDFDHIGKTIHQPRLWGRNSDAETIWTTPAEVFEWSQTELIPSINLALSDNAPRCPGDWCRYCPAKLGCPELSQQLQFMKPPFPTTNDQLAWLMAMKGTLKELVSDAEIESAKRLMDGEDIPGFKPVRSYGKSVIVDPDRCGKELISKGLTHDQVYTKKLRGITELKKHKAAFPIVEKFKNRSDNGIKAAPMSSTKPAVAIPTQCFSNP